MIRVVTDSSCDLPSEVLEELGIVVVPVVVRIGRTVALSTPLGPRRRGRTVPVRLVKRWVRMNNIRKGVAMV